MITPAYALTATERVQPRLALDFTTGALDPRVSVSRALNTATRINSSGLVETVNADLPRFDYDPVTLAPKGLLIEESRQNILLYSSQFNGANWLQLASGTASGPIVTDDAGVAPDGTTTADRVVLNRGAGTTDSDLSRLFQNTGILASVGTFSVWMRSFDGASSYTVLLLNGSANTTVTVTPTWQRFTLVSSSTTTNAQIAVRGDVTQQTADLLIWGAQMEAGAFATSYIPTTTTSVTRNADVVTMTGTNFSSWFNASEGAFDCTFIPFGNEDAPSVLVVDDGTAQNMMRLYSIPSATTTRLAYNIRTGNVVQRDDYIDSSGSALNAVTGATVAYKAAAFAGAKNGGTTEELPSGTVPAVNQLKIGRSATAGSEISAWFQKIAYYPQRLISREVQAFSK